MKTSKIIILVVLIVLVIGAIFYFSLSNLERECESGDSDCDSNLQTTNNNADSSALTGMDKIERAIQDKLDG